MVCRRIPRFIDASLCRLFSVNPSRSTLHFSCFVLNCIHGLICFRIRNRVTPMEGIRIGGQEERVYAPSYLPARALWADRVRLSNPIAPGRWLSPNSCSPPGLFPRPRLKVVARGSSDSGHPCSFTSGLSTLVTLPSRASGRVP